MALLFFFSFVVCPFACFVCICTLLSIWLALGKSHLFIRMPLFLASTLPLGLLIGVVETQEFMMVCACVFGFLLLAASLTRSHIVLRVLALICGMLILTGEILGATHSWLRDKSNHRAGIAVQF